MNLNINSELRSLIPPLQKEEYNLLEESILEEGCRDALIVWDETIVDGHNRYEICTKHGISFEVEEKHFDSIEAVREWMIDNQLGRRNLTLDQRRILIGKRYNNEKREHGGDRSKRPNWPFEKSNSELPASSTAERLAEENNTSPRSVKRYAKDAEFFEELEEKDPETAQKVWSGEEKLSTVKKAHVSNNSGEIEWYTPSYIIESAKKAMGGIDVDPASSVTANTFVEADFYYTKDTDGLSNEWHGNVWMNPPYGQPLINDFINTFCQKWDDGEFKQGIVLVNNATETRWFQSLLDVCDCVCFPKGRISYMDKNGEPSKTPLQGQAILYFGENSVSFCDEFSKHGICVWKEV